MAPAAPNAPIGIYIHIPFCSHICPYCDFNTYRGQEALIPRYVEALRRDIATQAEQIESPAATIYLGGGTPSLLRPEQVEALLRACQEAFSLPRDLEITLEANPNRVDRSYFEGLLEAGVNRLSIGAQTFDYRGLRTLGRQHEAADVERAFMLARDAGFDNISLDLIFGWPGQELGVWKRDLESVLALPGGPPEHLSLYSLIVEPGTPMADAVNRGILTALDDDATADMYETAIDLLEKAGWIHYEVANWARDPSLQSRHNLNYWRNGEYAAFGAGAHGRIGSRRWMNHLRPVTYIEAIECGENSESNGEELSESTQIGETMMLGLRLLREGVTDSEFQERHGCTLEGAHSTQLSELSALGLLNWNGDRATLTHRGLLLANDVCARFL
jgi:putative oxygen-independent coproporphyrinogen III oxidase